MADKTESRLNTPVPLGKTLTSITGNDTSKLRLQTGLLKKLDVAIHTSKAAGNALKEVEGAKVVAQTNIELAAIHLAETTIVTSMVANAMSTIGTLITQVNSAMTAVDQALTNGAMAQVVTHMENRSLNLTQVGQLLAEHKITDEEVEALMSFCQVDAVEDIRRSRQRTADAKQALTNLHDATLLGIISAKDQLP